MASHRPPDWMSVGVVRPQPPFSYLSIFDGRNDYPSTRVVLDGFNNYWSDDATPPGVQDLDEVQLVDSTAGGALFLNRLETLLTFTLLLCARENRMLWRL